MKNSDVCGRFFTARAAVCVLSLLLLNALASGVQAQTEDTLGPLRAFWANKLPDTTQLKNDYTNLTTRPFGREDLALSLLVPSHWKDTKVTVKKEELEKDSQNWIPLTLQVPPEVEKSEAAIQVAYIRLDLEMSLYDYMDQHLEANNYTVLLRRQGVYNKREVDEAIVQSKNQVARLTFSRHGDRIFAVLCSSPRSEYQRHALSFAAAAVSFTVQNKSHRLFPTPMTTFSPAKAPRYSFKYPEYWEMEEASGQPVGQSGVEIRMAAPDEKGQVMTYGYIYVQGYDKSTGKTPSGALEDVRKALEAKPLTFKEKILSADLAPGQAAPLFQLERFRAAVKGVPAEAATLVVLRGSDLLALSLVAPTREANLLAWMHCWRIFEIVAGDIAGKELPIAHVKSLIIPSEEQLISLVSKTMEDFSLAVKAWDFSAFFDDTSRFLQIQSSADRLRSAFSSFSKQPEILLLDQHEPVFSRDSSIDPEGLLKVEGFFSTKPLATTFQLTYLYEKPQWKLMGINLAMRKDPTKAE